jgi:hypothetical protein
VTFQIAAAAATLVGTSLSSNVFLIISVKPKNKQEKLAKLMLNANQWTARRLFARNLFQ